MLLAGVELQCIVLRCIWRLLGFSFCLQCVPFYDIFLFSAFSFIASVKVTTIVFHPHTRTLTYAPDHGLDAVKF